MLSRSQLADELGKHPQTVTKWTAAGCPVARRGRSGKGHLYLRAQVEEWLEAREAQAAKAGGPLDLQHERARKEYWQAQLNEQRFREREGELLPRDEVERQWSAEVAAVRARILAMPTTHADALTRAAVVEGVEGVEVLLAELARNILSELSDPNRPDPEAEAPKKKKKPAVRRRRKKKKTTAKKPPAAGRSTKKKATKKKPATKKKKKTTAKKPAARKRSTKKKPAAARKRSTKKKAATR